MPKLWLKNIVSLRKFKFTDQQISIAAREFKGVAIALFCFAAFWFILLMRSLMSMAMTEKMYRMAQK